MYSEFSEIAFSFAVLDKLLSRVRPFKAPFFPSQVMEAWAPFDLEYALTSTASLFIQFKVSAWMKNRSAEEFPTIKQKYYRFDLLRREIDATTRTSAQHNLLKYLYEQKFGPVYYVAPMFYLYSDYELYSHSIRMLQESIFIDFHIDGLSYVLDDELHRMAFLSDASAAWQCSEPREVGAGKRGSKVLDEILTRIREKEGDRQTDPDRLALPQGQVENLRALKLSLIAGVREHLRVDVILGDDRGERSALRDLIRGMPARYWVQRWSSNRDAVFDAVILTLEIYEICRRYYNAAWLPY